MAGSLAFACPMNLAGGGKYSSSRHCTAICASETSASGTSGDDADAFSPAPITQPPADDSLFHRQPSRTVCSQLHQRISGQTHRSKPTPTASRRPPAGPHSGLAVQAVVITGAHVDVEQGHGGVCYAVRVGLVRHRVHVSCAWTTSENVARGTSAMVAVPAS